MEEIKRFFFILLMIAFVIIVFIKVGYELASRHYEPLLSDCEQNQINWDIQHQRLKEIERKFDKAEMIIELEEAKRQASIIWNQGLIEPEPCEED